MWYNKKHVLEKMFEVSKITAKLVYKWKSSEMKSNGGMVHFECKACVESVCSQSTSL